MFKERNKIFLLYYTIDVLLIFLSFAAAYYLRFNPYGLLNIDFVEPVSPNRNEYIIIFVVWAVLIMMSLRSKNLYCTDRSLNILREAGFVFECIVTVSVFIGAIIFFTQYKFFSRFVFAVSLLFLVFNLICWRLLKRLILRQLIKKGFHNFNVLFVGENEMTPCILEEIQQSSFLGLRIIGLISPKGESSFTRLPVLGSIKDFETICKKYFIDEVIISSLEESQLLSVVAPLARRMHLGVRVVPFSFEAPDLLSIQYIGIVPLLTYQERQFHPTEFFGKRIFDIVCSAVLLIVLAPLFLFICLLIIFDDGGPVFYIQKRMGRKGEVFNFYKFRSMVKDADKKKADLMARNEIKDGIIFKIKDDPRMTRVGRLLRRYSLDELPQLWNVLKGNMSLVGPRPFPVSESQQMDSEYKIRHMVRPGITGLAQIRGRSDLSFINWMKWDLWYINNWSFWLDVKILWRTVIAVLQNRGAY